ncbi:hypothetical protein GOP47_0028637 [Adiantum capillus-veneris]|nr:hypothetical protein GOP47_0028637 [Adiantum capillus-veneris]
MEGVGQELALHLAADFSLNIGELLGVVAREGIRMMIPGVERRSWVYTQLRDEALERTKHGEAQWVICIRGVASSIVSWVLRAKMGVLLGLLTHAKGGVERRQDVLSLHDAVLWMFKVDGEALMGTGWDEGRGASDDTLAALVPIVHFRSKRMNRDLALEGLPASSYNDVDDTDCSTEGGLIGAGTQFERVISGDDAVMLVLMTGL